MDYVFVLDLKNCVYEQYLSVYKNYFNQEELLLMVCNSTKGLFCVNSMSCSVVDLCLHYYDLQSIWISDAFIYLFGN